MAGNSIKTTWTADDREILKSMIKQQKEITKIQQKLVQTGRAGQQAGMRTAAGMKQSNVEGTKFAKGISGIFSTLGGIAAIAQALKEEFNKKKRGDEAKRVSSLSAGQAIRELKVNFRGDKTLTEDQLEGMVEKLALDTRSTVPIASAVLQTAFSANSAENIVAVDAARRALQIDPRNPGQAATLAGRSLDVVASTGSKNIAANQGFLSQIQLASRVTTPELVGQNLVPAIGSLVSLKDTPEQAAELVSTLTKLIGDETGRISATAAINLGSKLDEFVPKRKGKDKRGSFTVPQEQIEEFEKAEGTTAKIGVLQKSPELRREFFSEATFDAKARNFIKQLLSGDPKALAVQADVKGKIDPLLGEGQKQQAERFEQRLKFLESGKFQPVLTAQQQSETNIEKAELGDAKGTRRAETRKILEETLAKTDLPGIDFGQEKLFKAVFETSVSVGAVPETAGISVIESIIKRFEKAGRVDDPQVQLLRDQQAVLRQLLADFQRSEQHQQARAIPTQPQQARAIPTQPQQAESENLGPLMKEQIMATKQQTTVMKDQLRALNNIQSRKPQVTKRRPSQGLSRTDR